MSFRTTPVYAAALAVSALLAAALSATPALAATTTLTVPAVPYVAATNGSYNVADTPMTPSTTSLTFTLPEGAWQGRGINSLTYSLNVNGPKLSGTAQIASNKITIPIPAGFVAANPAGTGPDGYHIQLSGNAFVAPSTPHPTRNQLANCDSDPAPGYSLSLFVIVPYSSAAGPASPARALDTSNVVPGSMAGSITCYWVTPPSPLTVAPGDAFTYQAPTSLFAGTWTSQLGWGGGGEGTEPVSLATSVSHGSETLTASIPPSADLSSYAGAAMPPNIGLFRFDKDPATTLSTSVYVGTAVTVKGWSPTVSRIAGSDRFDTSVALSKAGYPSTAPVVVVATGMNYPDALAAGPAAAKLGGPLLLTASTSLPASVASEIKRLKPSTIVIVGGLSAVSSGVEQQLKKLAATVVRVSGSDRFDTARKIVTYAFPSATKAYLATAMNYPDALSAAAAAGAQGSPVVLVNGSAGSIDGATNALLSSRGITSATIVGGTSAVSAGIEASLKGQLGSAKVVRLAGADRFATSVLVAKEAFTSSNAAYVATGLQFPDALAGSALAGAKHAPLFTSMPTCLPAGAKQEMQSLKVATVTLIGGVNALSANVAALRTC